MIVNIRDPQTLRQINPTNLSAYLQQNNWHEKHHVESHAAFWTKRIEDNEEAEVVLPLNSEFADFHYRISEILQTLAIVEHRLPEEVFNDLVNLSTETITKNLSVIR